MSLHTRSFSLFLFYRFDLEEVIDSNGGLVKIPNVLPLEVANGIYDTLTNIRDEEWQLTEVYIYIFVYCAYTYHTIVDCDGY